MKFRNEVIHTLISQFFIILFGIATSVVLNRILGPSLKGELVALLLIPQLIVAFTNLGLGTSTSYYIGKAAFPQSDILKTNFVVSILIGTIGITIGWVILKNWYPGISILLRCFILSMIVFGLWFDYLPDIFLGKGKIISHNYWNLIKTVTEFAFISIFILLTANKLKGAITGTFGQSFLLWALSFLFLAKWLGNGKINFSYLKNGINFGYKIFLANALIFLSYRADIFILKWLSDPSQIGYYSTAVGLAEKLWIIPGAISLVLYSKIVASNYGSDKVLQATRISLWVVTGVGLISILIIRPLILLLYSSAFLPSVIPYLILLPGAIGLTVVRSLMTEVVGRWGKPELSIMGILIAVIVNIILNLLLVPKLKMNGAAIASSIAYLIELVYFVMLYTKITHIPIKDIFILKKGDLRYLKI